jgi:hypothetical protein
LPKVLAVVCVSLWGGQDCEREQRSAHDDPGLALHEMTHPPLHPTGRIDDVCVVEHTQLLKRLHYFLHLGRVGGWCKNRTCGRKADKY